MFAATNASPNLIIPRGPSIVPNRSKSPKIRYRHFKNDLQPSSVFYVPESAEPNQGIIPDSMDPLPPPVSSQQEICPKSSLVNLPPLFQGTTRRLTVSVLLFRGIARLMIVAPTFRGIIRVVTVTRCGTKTHQILEYGWPEMLSWLTSTGLSGHPWQLVDFHQVYLGRDRRRGHPFFEKIEQADPRPQGPL